MKTILASVAAIVVIALAASFGLERAGFSSQDQQTSSSVRVD